MANQLIEGKNVIAELAYLIIHELKVRKVRTNPFITQKMPVKSKDGALAHQYPIKGSPVECGIEYELPRISTQDLTQTIQQLTTDYLLDAARDIAEFIADRGRGKLVSMAPMELPVGISVDWAERVTDPANGIELRLCRNYDMTHNYMNTVVSARYLVSN